MGMAFENMVVFAAVTVGAYCIGSVMLYILVTYSLRELYVFLRDMDFSFIRNVGMVFYGGLVTGVIGAIVCAKILKLDISKLEKSVVPYVPIGHAIGRIGCLLAGCCHGIRYNGAFAVKSLIVSAKNTYFPVQALEAILNVVIALFLLVYIKKEHRKYDVLTCYLMMYSIARFFLEFLRGDEIRGAFFVLSTSQWVSIFVFVLSFSIRQLKHKKEKVH